MNKNEARGPHGGTMTNTWKEEDQGHLDSPPTEHLAPEQRSDVAARGKVALDAYEGIGMDDQEDVTIASLIADLLHLAEENGHGATAVWNLAHYHYTALDGGTLGPIERQAL